MKNKILALLTILTVLLMPTFSSLAFASSTASESDVCVGVSQLSGNSSGSCVSSKASGSSIDGILSLVLNLLSGVVALVAVIMIILGGMKYVTSSGNAERTNEAKNTIMYSAIGLVIVALAQIIIKFILHRASAL